MTRTISAVLALVAASAAQAGCKLGLHLDAPYSVCSVQDPDRIGLWLYDADGVPFGNPRAIPAPLEFATNGGMYHEDRRPVGHLVLDGVEAAPLVLSEGPGNFGLLPNGVFCVGETAHVIETRNYATETPACRIATQSGPMLVIDGEIHPKFLPDGTSFKYRAGVGVDGEGVTHFAVSGAPVRFHDFATLFRDTLGTPNALFLDGGSATRAYAPELGRDDVGPQMGPIVGVLAQ